MTQLYSTRDTCRLCDSKDIELVVPLGKSPVSEKYVTRKNLSQEQERVPLDLYFCKYCSHVQLIDVVDPDSLWSDFTFKTAQKPDLVKHMQIFAKKDEVKTLQKYVTMWEPIKFVTENQVEEIIKEQLSKK